MICLRACAGKPARACAEHSNTKLSSMCATTDVSLMRYWLCTVKQRNARDLHFIQMITTAPWRTKWAQTHLLCTHATRVNSSGSYGSRHRTALPLNCTAVLITDRKSVV